MCIPDVTTRAELKAAVDSCVGDQLCELTMPHWDVSQVTDMSFLFQSMTGFNVDISRVGDVAGYRRARHVRGRHELLPGPSRAGPSPTTRTRRGCSRAPTPGSPVNRARMGSTRRTGRRAHGSSARAWRTSASRSELCAPCTGGGTRAAGDDPALGRHVMRVSRQSRAEGRRGQLHRRRSTGVACCSHGADCGAAGTVEMADWDVSLVTSMSELVQ